MENSRPKWMLLLLLALLACDRAFAAGPYTTIDQRELAASSSTSSNTYAVISRYFEERVSILPSDYNLDNVQRARRYFSELGNDRSDKMFLHHGLIPTLTGVLRHQENQRSAIAPGYLSHRLDSASVSGLPGFAHSRLISNTAAKMAPLAGQFTHGNVMMGGDFNQLRLLVSLSQADSALGTRRSNNSPLAAANTAAFSSDFDASANLSRAAQHTSDLTLKNERFEAQLSSNNDLAIQWLVGMYQQTTEVSTDYAAFQGLQYSKLQPLAGDQYTRGERAVFGGGSLELPGNVNLSVGLSYLDYGLSRRVDNIAVTEAAAPLAAVNSIGDSVRSRNSSEASNYRVTLSWDYNNDSQAYISLSDVARAQRRSALHSTQGQVLVCEQGFSAAALDRNRPVDDGVENLELGLRAAPSTGLRINAALYRTQWADGEARLNHLSHCGVNLSGNLSAAVSIGLELGMAAALTEYLTINAGLGYSDGQFSESLGAGRSQQLSEAPELSWSLSADWSQPIGDGELFVFGSVSYVDESSMLFGLNAAKALRFTDEGSQLKTEQTMVDLRLGYSSGDRWQAAVFVDNLTDEKTRYSDDGTVINLPGYDRGARSRPRTVGVSASYSF